MDEHSTDTPAMIVDWNVSIPMVTWGLEPKTGTVLVTITGLSGAATEAGTISRDLAITLSAPSAGTSTGESDEVLIRTYDVTYAPPDLHRLIAADVGMETKQAMVADAVALGCEPRITSDSASLVLPCWSAGCNTAGLCAFSGVQSSFYWSSTSFVANPSQARSESLVGGSGASPKLISFFVWPVRGGQ